MAFYEFTLRGDQIGTFTSLSGDGNGVDRIVTIDNVSALAPSTELFTIRIDQANDGSTEFSNGQLITILDSSGNVVMSQTGVQPDIEQGLGAGDEHLIIQNTGYLIDIAGLNPGPETIQYAFDSQAGISGYGDDDGNLDFADTTSSFPCFTRGTLIKTPNGEKPVENIVTGDLVTTLDEGDQPIVWIRSRQVNLTQKTVSQKPVLITAGSLGQGKPNRDLIVSPQHRFLFDFDGSRGSNSEAGILLAAKGMTGLKGVRMMQGKNWIEYFSVLLPTHQLIWANGSICESFYPGDYMLSVLDKPLRDEIHALFPLLKIGACFGYGPTARPSLTVQRAKNSIGLMRAA